MSEEKDRYVKAFREEATELLAELESSLLELECEPGNMETVSSVFRAFHTIKGSGAMFGFEDMSGFTHEIETVYDLVRNGRIEADKSLIDLTLAACDLISEVIASPGCTWSDFDNRAEDILSSFKRMLPEALGTALRDRGKVPGEKADALPVSQDHRERHVTYRIRFRPSQDIFSKGVNPILLLRELRDLGECRVVAHTSAIPELEDMDPESSYTYWDAVLTTDRGIDNIKDVFIFVEDACELRIDVIDEGESELDAVDYKRLGEILVEKRDLSNEDLEKILNERRPIGEMLVTEGMTDAASVQAALAEQEQVRKIREGRQRFESIANIRVSSRKLDNLVNLVGEMVTVQARLSQLSVSRTDPELLLIAEEVERLTAEIRDNAMDIRMLPIGTTFGKFRRLVRDLSLELGKEVEVATEGGETELDKTVIEKLNDPMVHLIRNCIDHGIESPESREQSGKRRKGTVRLSASHSGAHVMIKIMDDGAGIDGAAILDKAVERGLVQKDAALSEKEIFSLILLPGFTTAEDVTNVSGRGVGMDVVKRSVDSLRGSIDIESKKGAGTTITLSLPLTLAIIEGLLVKIGDAMFVLPLSSVEECVELVRRDAEGFGGRHVLNIRGQIIPYIRLREQFTVSGERPDIEQIVIIKEGGTRVGFVVDVVVGEHQTVIKTLGKIFRDIEGISGASILGDGSVALILDVPKLVRIAEKEEVNAG